MYCQKCGSVDDGGVRCSVCGSNEYGPEKPELTNEQIEAQAKVVRSNKVQSPTSSANSSGAGCATFVIALVIVGIMWLFGAFDY